MKTPPVRLSLPYPSRPAYWVGVVLALHATIALHSITRNFVAVDENILVPVGLFHWKTGHFGAYNQNPPLIKMALAVPLLLSSAQTNYGWLGPWDAGGVQGPFSSSFMKLNREHYFQFFKYARVVNVLFSLFAGFVIYRWTADLYGLQSGLLATTLWAFCPFVLAWTTIATVDMGATAVGVFALFLFRRYCQRPEWPQAVIAGFALGLAELSKFTFLLLVPLLPLVAAVFWWLRAREGSSIAPRARTLLGHCVLGIGMTVGTLNLGYLCEGTGTALGDLEFASRWFAGSSSPGNRFSGSALANIPSPLPRNYLLGLDRQFRHLEGGMYPSYLHGEMKSGGWYYYYLYGLLVKLPLGTVVIVLSSFLVSWLVRTPAGSRADEAFLYLVAFGLIGGVSLQTGFNHHLRYVLPALPFLLIGTGKLASASLVRSWWVRAAVVILAGLSVASSLKNHPYHLSYFNEMAGGPENGWRHLIDSNYDWGQDLIHLKEWRDTHPECETLHLAYFNMVDPSLIGLRYEMAPTCGGSTSVANPSPTNDGPQPGWHAVSVNFVCGLPFSAPGPDGQPIIIPAGAYSYFQWFTPVARAGHSLFIYHLTREEVNRARAEHGLPLLPAD